MPRCVNDNGSVNASFSGRPKILLLAVNKLLFGVNKMQVTLAHGVCCELLLAPLPFTSSVQLHILSLVLFGTIGVAVDT